RRRTTFDAELAAFAKVSAAVKALHRLTTTWQLDRTIAGPEWGWAPGPSRHASTAWSACPGVAPGFCEIFARKWGPSGAGITPVDEETPPWGTAQGPRAGRWRNSTGAGPQRSPPSPDRAHPTRLRAPRVAQGR